MLIDIRVFTSKLKNSEKVVTQILAHGLFKDIQDIVLRYSRYPEDGDSPIKVYSKRWLLKWDPKVIENSTEVHYGK